MFIKTFFSHLVQSLCLRRYISSFLLGPHQFYRLQPYFINCFITKLINEMYSICFMELHKVWKKCRNVKWLKRFFKFFKMNLFKLDFKIWSTFDLMFHGSDVYLN